MSDEYFTLPECAKILGVTRCRAYQVRHKLGARKIGCQWLVKPASLRAYMECKALRDAQPKKRK